MRIDLWYIGAKNLHARSMHSDEKTRANLVSNNVTININLLCTFMEDNRLMGNMKSRLIVTI